MRLIDTHCHIHSREFFMPQEAEAVLDEATRSGVSKLLLVGTDLEDSKMAVQFAQEHPENCWAAVGIHPHEAAKLRPNEITEQLDALSLLAEDEKVVAIGECGFDFYYNDRSQYLTSQEVLLRGQLEIAHSHQLPLSFHVREAFDDFWRVFESYQGIKGVLHSFTDKKLHLERALKHGLVIGINGIATFTTHQWQRDLFRAISLDNFVLETDAPFLTPKPKRGNINSPENVIYITRFLAELRGESEETVAKATTANAEKLFNLA